ncbi:superoxide dismutase family protein [Streptomyces johnsoniae]|uniref:Superoxide dismutase family protein n=1 Tax=Streptomyces johnsoniae TaxID=3075532 RepID=A0ABU2S3Z7_9ACTN|nr:superoxide dismutase family protein [Streptomyces sp. DSM 41886]MDT0443706.1 superoxide dismutase family protein [Streptomyces sp. DSM 41886]
MRILATGAAAMAAVLATAGAAVAAAGQGDVLLYDAGRFAPVGEAGGEVPKAVTYDEELVPAGSTIHVAQAIRGEAMQIEVAALGLVPGHTYGTHVHTEPCGADPADSGGHYQDEPGVVDAQNEVWLDFTVDARGVGKAETGKNWLFRTGGAGSVVLHERATSEGHDEHPPGDAGGRVACFTLPFAGEDAAAR